MGTHNLPTRTLTHSPTPTLHTHTHTAPTAPTPKQDLLTRDSHKVQELAGSLLEVACRERGVELSQAQLLEGCEAAGQAIHEGALRGGRLAAASGAGAGGRCCASTAVCPAFLLVSVHASGGCNTRLVGCTGRSPPPTPPVARCLSFLPGAVVDHDALCVEGGDEWLPALEGCAEDVREGMWKLMRANERPFRGKVRDSVMPAENEAVSGAGAW